MVQRAGGQLKGTGQVVLLILAWRHDSQLVPRGIQAQPTLGNRWISSSSANTIASHHVSCSNAQRMRAGRRLTQLWVVTMATSSARFHTQPTLWS